MNNLVSDQRYIFDEQAQNPFTFASWCAVVVPDSWQVGDQGLDTLSGCRAQVGIFRIDGTSIFFLGLGKLGEFLVPAPFQTVRHQTVFRPDQQELTLRQ